MFQKTHKIVSLQLKITLTSATNCILVIVNSRELGSNRLESLDSATSAASDLGEKSSCFQKSDRLGTSNQ